MLCVLLIIHATDSKPKALRFVSVRFRPRARTGGCETFSPADANLFVSVSLDYPQIYEGMVNALARTEALAKEANRGSRRKLPKFESPFEVYEKKLGLKIKDDLLPLLGKRVGPGVVRKAAEPIPFPFACRSARPNGLRKARLIQPSSRSNRRTRIPVVAISIKDRDAVARLIPKLIEALGLKGANLFAQTEKREGTEITRTEISSLTPLSAISWWCRLTLPLLDTWSMPI